MSSSSSEIQNHKITSIEEDDCSNAAVEVGGQCYVRLLSRWSRTPLAVHYTHFTPLSTNVNCMRLPQQFTTCARLKTLLQSILGHKTCFARWFPASLPHRFLQHFKACRARLNLMQRACHLSVHCILMPFSTAAAIILLLNTSVAFPSPGRSDPSLMLLQVVLEVGAVEYHGWDFPGCVRGSGPCLVQFFRKREWLIPLVIPTCKKRASPHIVCSKDSLRYTVN